MKKERQSHEFEMLGGKGIGMCTKTITCPGWIILHLRSIIASYRSASCKSDRTSLGVEKDESSHTVSEGG